MIYFELLNAIPPAAYWSAALLACVVCICLTVLLMEALSVVKQATMWAGREITRRRLRQTDMG